MGGFSLGFFRVFLLLGGGRLGTAAVAGGLSMSSSLQQQDPPVMGDILARWPVKTRRSYAELNGAFTFPKASPTRISFSLPIPSLFLVIKGHAQRRIIPSLLCTEYYNCIDCSSLSSVQAYNLFFFCYKLSIFTMPAKKKQKLTKRELRPRKNAQGTSAGIPRASGQRDSPVSGGPGVNFVSLRPFIPSLAVSIMPLARHSV